eukprot:3797354-Amphidinium_carterae.1
MRVPTHGTHCMARGNHLQCQCCRFHVEYWSYGKGSTKLATHKRPARNISMTSVQRPRMKKIGTKTIVSNVVQNIK